MNRIIKFVCLFLAIAIVIIPLKRTVTRTSDDLILGELIL